MQCMRRPFNAYRPLPARLLYTCETCPLTCTASARLPAPSRPTQAYFRLPQPATRPGLPARPHTLSIVLVLCNTHAGFSVLMTFLADYTHDEDRMPPADVLKVGRARGSAAGGG